MTTKDKLLELINVIIESYEGEYDNATEAKWNLYWGEKVQQLKQIKSIIEFHFSMTENWFPTAKSINALPEPIRKYIHDIETNCDPAGMVRENVILKDTIKTLQQPDISEEKSGPIEVERESIRAEQSREIMPLIGTLLDAWDDVPNDIKSDPELERFMRQMQKIDVAMEEK